jgi:hypothetical protein
LIAREAVWIAPRFCAAFPGSHFEPRRATTGPGIALYIRCKVAPLQSESIMSILWQFARASRLPGHALVRLTRADIDPHEGLAPICDATQAAAASGRC